MPSSIGRAYAITPLVEAASPMTLSVLVTRDPVQPGESLIYTLSLGNRGTVAVNDVLLRTTSIAEIGTIFNANLSDGGTCPGGGCKRTGPRGHLH